MTLSNYNFEAVKSLIRVLNSGIDFYKKAASETTDNRYNDVFSRMITEKVRAIALLQPFVVADEGSIEEGNALAVEIRESYTHLIGMFKKDNIHLYLSQLEELEDKVLEKVNKALATTVPAPCEAALYQIKERMKLCHDEMRALDVITQ
ncbi:PA2169 family four-helix-bundle protein [Pseudoalteromonas xiamenensis]|uniref:PA2169 family four-helix-bundle protein n=1 Tax=Pseudoalteromonas xiamenensis TaxID=882626 RepID=UPI0027E590E3|nr:PA2169 family four-helix-bundle protein [Pseudoalteromonas xiamenensis]WMN59765.1 PA2169 family four-helix-bundle protein [Pseudoalteromonas xiamenensis]